MRVSDYVGAGARANAVANPSTVSKVRSIRYSEGVAVLGDNDPRDLPAPEEFVLQVAALEKRQGVNVADSKIVALIETRAGAIDGGVVRIHERAVIAVGGIVNGMAVGVGDA